MFFVHLAFLPPLLWEGGEGRGFRIGRLTLQVYPVFLPDMKTLNDIPSLQQSTLHIEALIKYPHKDSQIVQKRMFFKYKRSLVIYLLSLNLYNYIFT